MGLPDSVTAVLFDLDGGADKYGRTTSARVEADIRQLPGRPRRPGRTAVRRARLSGVRERSPPPGGCARLPAIARHHPAGRRSRRPGRRADRVRVGKPQERGIALDHRERRGAGVSGIGRLRPRGARPRAARRCGDILGERRSGRTAGRDGADVVEPGPPRQQRDIPDRRRDRSRRVFRAGRQQHLHQCDGQTEHARSRRNLLASNRSRRTSRRRRGRDRSLARVRRGNGDALQRGIAGPRPVRGLHPARAVGFRGHTRRPLSAAAALPVLRPLPQAGRQTGRSHAGHVPVPRRIHRRASRART